MPMQPFIYSFIYSTDTKYRSTMLRFEAKVNKRELENLERFWRLHCHLHAKGGTHAYQTKVAPTNRAVKESPVKPLKPNYLVFA